MLLRKLLWFAITSGLATRLYRKLRGLPEARHVHPVRAARTGPGRAGR